MKKYEKDEIQKLPPKYRPIRAWGYFGLNILFAIPVIGWICLIVFACSKKNIVRRSYARSFFCGLIIAVIVVGIMLILSFTVLKDVLGPVLEQIMQAFPQGGAGA